MGESNPTISFFYSKWIRGIYMSYYEKIAERMIYMCIVYEFPMKKEFPKELEERLNEATKAYVEIMAETLDVLYDGEPTEEDYEEYMEIMLNAYLQALTKAIDELD